MSSESRKVNKIIHDEILKKMNEDMEQKLSEMNPAEKFNLYHSYVGRQS